MNVIDRKFIFVGDIVEVVDFVSSSLEQQNNKYGIYKGNQFRVIEIRDCGNKRCPFCKLKECIIALDEDRTFPDKKVYSCSCIFKKLVNIK